MATHMGMAGIQSTHSLAFMASHSMGKRKHLHLNWNKEKSISLFHSKSPKRTNQINQKTNLEMNSHCGNHLKIMGWPSSVISISLALGLSPQTMPEEFGI